MPHTRILDDATEVTIETLRAAVNLRVSESDSEVVIRDVSGREIVRASPSRIVAEANILFFFLEGKAFDYTEESEVYACFVIPEMIETDAQSMGASEIEVVYETVVRSLAHFDENMPCHSYLAVEFKDDIRFVFVEYLPQDDLRWSLAFIFNEFGDHSW